MSKTALKERIIPQQNGRCALSGVKLPDNLSLTDTDRKTERFQGGTYTNENTRIVTPVAHMARHGILRERDAWLDELKTLMDDRQQTMKLLFKIRNQLLAYKRRTDHVNPENVVFLQDMLSPIEGRLSGIDRRIGKHLKTATDPLVRVTMEVPGVGPITTAGLTTYVDLEKADSPSALWKYVGLHAASNARYTKGEAGGGNKTLRTILWNTANSMMKDKTNPYRAVYDADKRRREVSEKLVLTRNNQGQLVEKAWKDVMPSHRHGAALRAVIKHLLADYWLAGRELKGLSTRTLYAEQILHHDGIIAPSARGWKV